MQAVLSWSHTVPLTPLKNFKMRCYTFVVSQAHDQEHMCTFPISSSFVSFYSWDSSIWAASLLSHHSYIVTINTAEILTSSRQRTSVLPS